MNQTKEKIDLTEIPQRKLQEEQRVLDIKKEIFLSEQYLYLLTDRTKDMLLTAESMRRLRGYHKTHKQNL